MFKSKIVGFVVQVCNGRKVLAESVIHCNVDDVDFQKDIGVLGDVQSYPPPCDPRSRNDINISDIVKLHSDGMSYNDIAAHFKCSPATIYKVKKSAKSGQKKLTKSERKKARRSRRSLLNDDEKRLIVEQYKNGEKVRVIAEKLGVHPVTVNRRLQKEAIADSVISAMLKQTKVGGNGNGTC